MDQSTLPTQTEEEDLEKNYAYRDGNLFVIDASPEMFEIDPNEGTSHFLSCLHCYGRILSQKLMWNKTDWMGLILYNATKNWDRDPETKNILTALKFGEVSIDMIKQLSDIIDNKSKKENFLLKNPPSDFVPDSSLHDALWQACRSFDSIKISMPLRQVVLLTCRDNPLIDDETERHKIRLRAKAYRDTPVKLRIVGLGDNWNHELFYKDIDLLSRNRKAGNVKRMRLDNLEGQVKFFSRTTDHLRLKIGGDAEIRIVIKPLSASTQYLKKVRMNRETNEILEPVTKMVSEWDDGWDDEDDNDLIEDDDASMQKGLHCGDRWIQVDRAEIMKLRIPMESGIDIIGFKPISLELEYHIAPAKYVGLDVDATPEERRLFAAILKNCVEKKLMAICSVSQRSLPYLAKMIPSLEYSGFYLYKTAHRENVNNLQFYTDSCPRVENGKVDMDLSPEGLTVTKKIIRKMRIRWTPFKFSNPKLNATLQYIEALALDWEYTPPEDKTRPPKEAMCERLGPRIQNYNEIFPIIADAPKKRPAEAPQGGRGKAKGAKKLADSRFSEESP